MIQVRLVLLCCMPAMVINIKLQEIMCLVALLCGNKDYNGNAKKLVIIIHSFPMNVITTRITLAAPQYKFMFTKPLYSRKLLKVVESN